MTHIFFSRVTQFCLRPHPSSTVGGATYSFFSCAQTHFFYVHQLNNLFLPGKKRHAAAKEMENVYWAV